jgi:hypothetical protein
MLNNYNASQIGEPYVKARRITIFDEPGEPTQAIVEQALCVLLKDGTRRILEARPTLTINLDLANAGNTPIQLVDPSTGAVIPGQFATLIQTELGILAVIRQAQLAADAANT